MRSTTNQGEGRWTLGKYEWSAKFLTKNSLWWSKKFIFFKITRYMENRPSGIHFYMFKVFTSQISSSYVHWSTLQKSPLFFGWRKSLLSKTGQNTTKTPKFNKIQLSKSGDFAGFLNHQIMC